MRAGFGYSATEKRIDSARAASYCAKYASKISPNVPKGFRRVRASRNWAELPDTAYQPLMVKSRRETVPQFLVRVSDNTGIGLSELYERWRDVMMDDDDYQEVMVDNYRN